MTNSEIRHVVREFITRNFLYVRPDTPLADDDSLMGRGIVDSMGVAEMLQFLDDELSVVVPDADITEANLGSIGAIAAYVEKHALDRDR